MFISACSSPRCGSGLNCHRLNLNRTLSFWRRGFSCKHCPCWVGRMKPSSASYQIAISIFKTNCECSRSLFSDWQFHTYFWNTATPCQLCFRSLSSFCLNCWLLSSRVRTVLGHQYPSIQGRPCSRIVVHHRSKDRRSRRSFHRRRCYQPRAPVLAFVWDRQMMSYLW